MNATTTDTPRTDALIAMTVIRMRDHARSLERENARLRAALEWSQRALQMAAKCQPEVTGELSVPYREWHTAVVEAEYHNRAALA